MAQYHTAYGTHIKKVGYGTLYIDGGCRPTNPGPAGIACVVDLAGKQYVLARPIGIKTNNQAEYMALVVGIKYAHSLGANGLDIYCDSKLIVNQMRYNWRVSEKHLRDFREQAMALLNTLFEKNWEIIWVPRGDNTVADAYCTQAILSNNPWIPNFNDPFRAPNKKWAPYARHRRFDDSLR